MFIKIAEDHVDMMELCNSLKKKVLINFFNSFQNMPNLYNLSADCSTEEGYLKNYIYLFCLKPPN
jgi:hypothetical protein